MKTLKQHSGHRLVAVVLTFALVVLGLITFPPPRAFAIGDTPEPIPDLFVPPNEMSPQTSSSSCLYDQATTTDVYTPGWGPSLTIERATQKTTYAGFCAFTCPNASYKWQGPGYCDCYNDTIPQLRQAGVGNWEIHRTRYAIWSEPPVDETITLLVALAGQNGVSSGGVLGGGPGNVTGQPDNWLGTCTDWNCGERTFSSASFVGRLLADLDLNITASNTFAVSFPDHQYDWGSSYRAQIRHGLFEWLKTKVSTTTLKQIIIAGHSRGACLALGLIKEFRDDPAFNAVKILGAPVDGTCMDGENGTLQWGGDIDNPLDVPWDWHAWPSTFTTANNQKVCIQNTAGGETQAGPFFVHSFYLTDPAWNNSWMNIPHFPSGMCSDNYMTSECGHGGSYHVKRDVVDRALRFVENNVLHVSLTPSSLVNGVVGSPYFQALALTGSDAAYTPPFPQTFTLTAGSLPPGLTLSAAGVLSGTPISGGTSSFTIRGKDANEFTAFQNYTLTIGIPDTTPPVITPTVSGTSGNSGWYKSTINLTWSVVDSESSVTTQVGCGPQTVSTDTAGMTFTCQATSAGGTASRSITIKRDAIAPVLNPTVSPNPVFLNGAVTASPGASDSTSGLASASCAPVTTSSAGSFTVACTATDNAGNVANASTNYVVRYQFLGFLSPLPQESYRVGSTIRVKFRLADASGTPLADATAQSLVAACRVKVGLDMATGCSAYDARNDLFQVDVKVPKNTSVGTHQIVVQVLASDNSVVNSATTAVVVRQ
jgi:hypothetical protein